MADKAVSTKAAWTKLPMRKMLCYKCQMERWFNPKAPKEGTSYRCTGCGASQ